MIHTTKQTIGTVIKELVTCGKDNCHCATGKKHPAYYHYFYIHQPEGSSKLTKKYLPKQEALKLKRAIEYRRYKAIAKEVMLSAPGEFYYKIKEPFPDDPLRTFTKRVQVMLRKAGIYSWSIGTIKKKLYSMQIL